MIPKLRGLHEIQILNRRFLEQVRASIRRRVFYKFGNFRSLEVSEGEQSLNKMKGHAAAAESFGRGDRLARSFGERTAGGTTGRARFEDSASEE